MIQTFELFPHVQLRCFQDNRFKHGCLSVQFVRLMKQEEAACNALIPAVLLRGTEIHRDLRDITLKLDDLYGASVSALVRRIGDYQTTGFYCSFIEDRFALSGDEILAPMVEFLEELLLQPVMEDGGFSKEFVESEKKNLISTIESEINDKRTYAAAQLLKTMCCADSFGLPRLGDRDSAQKMNHKNAYAHYQTILRESPVSLFYVGSAQPEQVASLLTKVFSKLNRAPRSLPAQTDFQDGGGCDKQEQMEVSQAKLCMGFVTPITNQSPDFAAMQVLNVLFGGGMTSKLFLNLREKMSLCYSIGSNYYGIKGIVTVGAGIDAKNEEISRKEILRQLELCKLGEISPEELTCAKEAILSGLRGVHDSPGAIENYYATHCLSGFPLNLQAHYAAVESVTPEQVAAAAKSLRLHTTYVLKGVTA